MSLQKSDSKPKIKISFHLTNHVGQLFVVLATNEVSNNCIPQV